MESDIWTETVLSWVNFLGLSSKIVKFEYVKQHVIEEIIEIIQGSSCKCAAVFINEIFPNFTINKELLKNYNENDYLCLCTLILIYVCFSNSNKLDTIKQEMCNKLENSTQEYLTDFFVSIQDQGDVFSLTKKSVMNEISKFTLRNSLRNSASGDGICTPVKMLNITTSCESPLFQFLQTPKQKLEPKPRHANNCSCSNNDQLRKIKELSDQLVEEELEKASAQEKLKWQEIKCNDLDAKLKSKVKELEQLKNEWQRESSKNEKEIKYFKSTLEKTIREKKKLSDELSYFENYVSTLEKELSSVSSEKKSLEDLVKISLCKLEEYEREVKRLSEINSELEETNRENEAELQVLKETYVYPNQNESINGTNLSESLNTSGNVPENMCVVIDVLLREKTSENESLQEALNELKLEQENLASEIVTLKSQLREKETENSQLKELNNDLTSKIDEFFKSWKALENAQLIELSKQLNEITVFNGLESKVLPVIYEWNGWSFTVIRNLDEMKKKLTCISYSTEMESRTSRDSDHTWKKDPVLEENFLRHLGTSSFPTITTEDEEEVFDNRCLENIKAGICKVEGSEGRLTELQYRNSLCFPHLKSSYPAETQFHNPKLFKENGSLNFDQSLTDSNRRMTRSLLSEEKGNRKEQPLYKKPGPPTPSKNGTRLSIQSGELHIAPRKVLRESNYQSDRKSTPGRITSLFTVKTGRRKSIGGECKDEETGKCWTFGIVRNIMRVIGKKWCHMDKENNNEDLIFSFR